MSSTNIRETTSSTREQKDDVLAKFPEPRRNTRQATGNQKRHTDADSIRREYGIPRWNRDRFDYPSVIPNCVEHTWDAPTNEASGGTDFLAKGKPGAGKSTLGNYLTTRLLEVNNEKVVWRGSSSRSEWMPLAPWARLCLPAGVEITARLEPKDPTAPAVTLDVDDLEQIVREVVRYEDPLDLNRNILQEGALHVVYPDPLMRGCQAVYDDDPEKVYDAPAGREELFCAEDPANHWWFGWALARVQHGPHHWTTWLCDEIGDICPQSAKKDSFGTYQKIELLKDSWVDMRKFGLTVGAFAHSETDVHEMIRRKLRWRIQMPGTANPTSANKLIGFESVRMNTDMTSSMKVGQALMYTETNFDHFAWKNMPSPTSYKLKIRVEGGQ